MGNNELRRPRNKHFLVFISQNRTSVAPMSFHLVWVSCQPDCFGLAKELQLLKTTAAACGTEGKQRPHPLEGQHWDILVVNSSGMSQLRGRKKESLPKNLLVSGRHPAYAAIFWPFHNSVCSRHSCLSLTLSPYH